MYVCICNAFTCKDVRKAKVEGVSKSSQVYKKLGCKMQCGKCLEAIEDVLQDNNDLDSLNTNFFKNSESSSVLV